MAPEQDDNQVGTILQILRMSTEDGPGLRTTVFFKGCGLRCSWCHNPESISAKHQLQWIGSRCINCRLCLETCPNGALSFAEQGLAIDRGKCVGCGACVEECPSTALEMWGEKWAVDGLVREVIKDKAFFENSQDGGITASGGDPTMQAPFVAAFLKGVREHGLHTALDTCGFCARDSLEPILPQAELVLFDLKVMDSEMHKRHTGASNEKILSNLRFVGEYMRTHELPRRLWIRTPIIPGATDHPDNIRGIGKFIAANLEGVVERWEMCSFNNLCQDKYIRLDLDWEFKNCELITRQQMERLAMLGRNSGVDPNIVHWSGSTKLEQGEEKKVEKKADLRAVKACSTD